MIGMKLKQLRNQKVFLMEYVAEKLNVSRQTVAKRENDETLPDILNAKALTELYEVSLDSIVLSDDEVPNEARTGKYVFGIMKVGENAYYNYRKNRKASCQKQKQDILEQIKSIYYNNNHRPMKIFLERGGISLSKTTIHKYMNKEMNLHAIVMRKKPSYVRGVKNKIFPNLLKQKFQVTAPNPVWCTDFTYIRLVNGKMRYNCSIIDLYDRSMIAALNSDYINTDLAIATLEKALETEKPGKGLIYPNHFSSAESLDEAVNRYVYVWYNHICPHSYNGRKTPFEARYA